MSRALAGYLAAVALVLMAPLAAASIPSPAPLPQPIDAPYLEALAAEQAMPVYGDSSSFRTRSLPSEDSSARPERSAHLDEEPLGRADLRDAYWRERSRNVAEGAIEACSSGTETCVGYLYMARYKYDAWGVFRDDAPDSTGFGLANPVSQALVNRSTYTGKYYDREANLFYFNARYYDPDTGRFISQDGFDYGDTSNPPSLHLYYYAMANPLVYIDPDGRDPITVKDYGTAFAGYVWGVGEVVASPGVFMYQAVGYDRYLATGDPMYKAQAESFERTAAAMGEMFSNGAGGLVDAVVGGFTGQVDRFLAAADRGDVFEASAGVGNFMMQGATLIEGGQSTVNAMRNAPAMSLATGGVVTTAEALAAVGRGPTVAAGTLMMQGALEEGKGAEPKVATEQQGDAPPGKLATKKPVTEAAKTESAQLKLFLEGDVYRDPKTGKFRDPKGHFVSDPDNPPSPYEMTDAQRRREWKRHAEDPSSPLTEEQRAEIKERGWRGPQQYNEYGELETMELSHEPVPLREGGTVTVPRWPKEHAQVDRYRHLKERD